MKRRDAMAACLVPLAASCGGPEDGLATPAGLQAPGTPAQGLGDAALVLDAPVALPGRGLRLRLTWRGARPSDRVSAWVYDNERDFHVVATGLLGGTADVDLGPSWSRDWPSAMLRLRACGASGPCVDSNVQPLGSALAAGVDLLEAETQDRIPGHFDGSRIALSADGCTLAVSNPVEGTATGPPPPGRGAVYVFRRDEAGPWRREAYVDHFDGPGSFGEALALSGDGRTLVVGAPSEDGWRGTVYVFEREAEGAWCRRVVLKDDPPGGPGSFGSQIAIDEKGERMVIASIGQRVHVFARDGTGAWRQEGVIRTPAENAFLSAATPIAFSGNGRVIAVPAIVIIEPRPVSPVFDVAVHVFTRDDSGTWVFSADLRSGKPPANTPGYEPNGFGHALALDHDGRTLAVGEDSDSSDAGSPGAGPANRNAPLSGAVHVFSPAGGTWQRQALLKPRQVHADDAFGTGVALSADGRVLLAKSCGLGANAPGVRRNHAPDARGCLSDNPNSPGCAWGGGLYVLTRNDAGRWEHVSAALAPGSGHRVVEAFALSADASTFVMGAARMFVY